MQAETLGEGLGEGCLLCACKVGVQLVSLEVACGVKTPPDSEVKDLERGRVAAGANAKSGSMVAEQACPIATPGCIGDEVPGLETTTCKAGAEARGPVGGRRRLGERAPRAKRD